MNKKIIILLKQKSWKIDNNNKKAFKVYTFHTFKNAFSWMTEVSFEAEKINHHPEWKNVYNKVEVTLTTHDTDELSSKDLNLASFMDSEFEKYK